jgi:hypothetical protein
MLDGVVPTTLIAGAYGMVVAASVAGTSLGTGGAGLLIGSSWGISGAIIAATVTLALTVALGVQQTRSDN